MPKFSKLSFAQLETCDVNLQRLFKRVVESFDCKVLEGHRPPQRQAELVRAGKSKTLRSKHLSSPSLAVDVAPFPIDWEDWKRFYLFGGFVLGIANEMGIRIRWGGDWDCDTMVKDNSFNDLVHFELRD